MRGLDMPGIRSKQPPIRQNTTKAERMSEGDGAVTK
jgi:hypothetical protein